MLETVERSAVDRCARLFGHGSQLIGPFVGGQAGLRATDCERLALDKQTRFADHGSLVTDQEDAPDLAATASTSSLGDTLASSDSAAGKNKATAAERGPKTSSYLRALCRVCVAGLHPGALFRSLNRTKKLREIKQLRAKTTTSLMFVATQISG